MRLSLLWSIPLALLCLSSCKKSLETSQPNAISAFKLKGLSTQARALVETGQITIENGRATFQTQDAFAQLMQQGLTDTVTPVIHNTLAALAPSQLSFISYADRNNDLGGGTTMMTRTGVTTNGGRPCTTCGDPGRGGGGRIDPEMDQDSLIEDPLFAQVTNAKGELKVENTIYKVTNNGTFAVTEQSLPQLEAMLDTKGYILPQYQYLITGVDPDNGLYKLAEDIYLYDTYSQIKMAANVNAPPTYSTVSGVGTQPYANMDVYPFNSRYTIAGKIVQYFFGDPHYKYFTKTADRRLKVNFYSRNWIVYSSTGVRAVIQKKNSFLGVKIWGPVDNKDEMRLGWTQMVIKTDIPAVTMPGTVPPKDPANVAAEMLKHATIVKLGDTQYTTLQVSDVINANNMFPFLPGDWADKLNNYTFDVNAFINSKKDSEIDALFKLIKTKIGYTAPSNKIAFINLGSFMIDSDVQVHGPADGNGVMSRTFDFNTAQVGFKSSGGSTTYIFKPAKTIEVIKGSCYAAGKLNGEWVGIAVQKK